MKDDEMLQAPQFSLYESMSATELCDPKMDWKCNLISADTYNKGLETKKIKQPNELTKEEVFLMSNSHFIILYKLVNMDF